MFGGKARSPPWREALEMIFAWLTSSLTNFKLARKGLSWTNTLAYNKNSKLTDRKSFIKLGQGRSYNVDLNIALRAQC
jgi:hypothetical protein